MSYTISLALYAARNFYTVYRELPGGKGFADLVFVPRKRYQDKPALVVELKWDKTAEGALAQIKDKEYCRSLEEYQGNLLLVGINYNKKTKEHVCRMRNIRSKRERTRLIRDRMSGVLNHVIENQSRMRMFSPALVLRFR